MSGKLIYINSRDRLSGTSSDFTYKIDILNQNYTHACVLAMSIPKSYYSIQSGQNTFTLSENGVETTITIPAGNYSRSSLKSVLQTQLNTGSYTYVVSIPGTNEAETGKFTFTVSGNSGIQPLFIFTDYLYEQIGFEKDSSNAFTADTMQSANVINLSPEQTLFLHSDLSTNQQDGILQEVFGGNSQSYSNINWTCPDVKAYSKKIISNNTGSYRFHLTNEDSQKIDLNGLNLVFTLYLYREIPVQQFMKAMLEK